LDRDQKAAAVAELTGELKDAGAIFAVDYRGIGVTEAAELRTRLRDADAVFKVVKNRLAKRAAADAGTGQIDDLLVGPTALTLIKGDAVIAAKAIATFSREHDVLEFKGGFMDGEPLDADTFQAIARLPGVDVLRGQLVGLAASPITGLAAGLNNLLSGLGRQLSQIAEQGLVSGEPPAAEAAEAAEPDTGDETAERDAEPAATPEPSPDDTAAEGEDVGGGVEAEGEASGGGTSEEPEEAPEETDTADADDAPAAEAESDTSEEVEAEGETSEDSKEE
jgi:large subunit ribosomal protein L10